ncbi:MAG: FAD-dependent oxidoreductase [Pseudomonadota bacterium]
MRLPEPPDDPSRKPVTILGAGIVGICTALSLLDRGIPVRIIDQGSPGQETSMGNAGVVSPWSFIPQAMPGVWKNIPKLLFGYGRPLSIHPRALAAMLPWGLRFLRQGTEAKVRATADAMSHLCGPSIELYRRHLAGTDHEDLLVDSCYVHAFRDGSRANLQSLDCRIRSEKGAELELIGQDRLAEMEPALSPSFQAAVIIHGQARVRSPGRLAAVLAKKAEQQGAEFVRAQIRSIKPHDDGWRILCDGERLYAPRLVLSMGAWSPELLAQIGLKVPMMVERGYHVECSEPNIEICNSVMDVDTKVVASSMEGGVRVAGQAEFAPADAPANPARETRLTQIAKAAFPNLNTERKKFWMGRRPSFPDSLPVLGPVTGHPSLFLNFGHSHYGLIMAPKSGELIAQLIRGETPNVPVDAFSATRFHW